MIYLTAKKTYDDKVVLEVENIKFQLGKIYAVIGMNGSGKSTLIKILAKQLNYEGITYIPQKLKVGYMPQYSYAFDLSVRNNIKIALNNKNNVSKIDDVIKSMGLWEFRKRKAKKLSGGETQKLALARVLVNNYDVLLFDEPTSAMDLLSLPNIENVLLNYIKENNSTLIFTTHSISQAQRLADYVIFLDKGKIIESNENMEFFQNPKSEIVKKFISLN